MILARRMGLQLLLVVAAAAAGGAHASPISRMAAIFPGVYDNRAQYLYDVQHQTPDNDFHPHSNSRLIKVPVPAIAPNNTFYIQQFEYDMPSQSEMVYRQAIYQLTEDPSNASTIVLTIWMLNEGEKWLNAWDHPGIFNNLTLEDVTMNPECRVYWEEVAHDVFRSYMRGNCTYNSSTGLVRITDENWLSPDYLTIHEQWFLPDGTKVYGLDTCMNETRQADRSPPVWPLQWHSDVLITGTQETSELEVEVIDTGRFFYNWDEPNDRGTTAMLMANISTGEVTRDVNLYGTFYYINDTSHSCFHFKIPGVNGPSAPTWLHPFSFNETQYLSKREGKADSHWASGAHWQYDAFGGGPQHLFNYWHSEDDLELPLRIMGPSFTEAPYGHSFIEIDNYHVGFDDVPDVDKLFQVPDKCAGPLDPLEIARAARTGDHSELMASAADAFSSDEDEARHMHHLKSLVDRVTQAGHLSPLILVSERARAVPYEDALLADKLQSELKSIVAIGRKARWARMVERHGADDVARAAEHVESGGYPLWPLQFHCNHTGNGITFDSAISPQTQKGVFYYDATLNRSSTMYYDFETGARSHQIFMNGWVYRINETSGDCTAGRLPDSFDIAGPVTPDFLKYFVRQKDQYNLRNHTAAQIVPGSGRTVDGLGLGTVVYSRTSHWTYWAFVADPDHAFHAWMQESNGMPFQILGPGPALPPYGLSFLGYESVVPNLDGIDLETIFHVPSTCSSLGHG